MAMIETSRLQGLAEIVDDDETAISVYLDLSPAATPTPGDLATRVRSAVDALRARRPDRGRDARRRFDAGRDRIASFLETEDVRGEGEVHGVAVFASGDDVFAAMPLWRAAGDLTEAGRRFVLRPLAAQAARTNELLLVEAGRELGRVLDFTHGRLIEIADADTHIANRHHQGGWMQARLQRDVDRQAELHLAEVVSILERVHAAVGRPPVVLAATGENAAVLRERMSDATAEAVIGEVGNVRDRSAAELHDALVRLAGEHDAAREEALLERRSEQLGRGELGSGLAAVLDAAYTGRIEALLIAPGANPDVFSCPQCGRLDTHASVCPYDGEFLQREPDGVEAAVSAALRAGAAVWELADVDRRDLDGDGGLGAIVRY